PREAPMPLRTLSLALSLTALAVCLPRAVPAGTKEKPKLQLSADEKKTLDLINEVRQKEKLPELKPHPVLFKVARAHSASQAKRREAGHVLDGKDYTARLRDSGYRFTHNSENIFFGIGPAH